MLTYEKKMPYVITLFIVLGISCVSITDQKMRETHKVFTYIASKSLHAEKCLWLDLLNFSSLQQCVGEFYTIEQIQAG